MAQADRTAVEGIGAQVAGRIGRGFGGLAVTGDQRGPVGSGEQSGHAVEDGEGGVVFHFRFLFHEAAHRFDDEDVGDTDPIHHVAARAQNDVEIFVGDRGGIEGGAGRFLE